MAPTVLALCSGVGGLEIGVSLALPGTRVVGHCERDSYAAAVLLARMEDAALDSAPIWCGDLAGFPCGPFAGRVDLVTAGFPCQPWSVAGKRDGQDDARWIWPEIARIIRDVSPGLVFLENVPGLVSGGGLEPVLGDLAALGFDAEWTCLRASEVGAPHRRERVFVLAHSRHRDGWFHEGGDGTALRASDGCEGLADAGGSQREGPLLACGQERSSIRSLGPWPPSPDGDWSGIPEWLWPAIRDRQGRLPGLLGNPDGGKPDGWRSGTGWQEGRASQRPSAPPESELRGLADGIRAGMESRADRLQCMGNAVVPLQAATAFAILARRIGMR